MDRVAEGHGEGEGEGGGCEELLKGMLPCMRHLGVQYFRWRKVSIINFSVEQGVAQGC